MAHLKECIMPKVKLLKIHTYNIYRDYDDYDSLARIITDTPWSEISQEDLDILNRFLDKGQYAIIEHVPSEKLAKKDELSLEKVIADCKKMNAVQIANIKKYEKQQKERTLKAEERKANKERKQYEKLREKFEKSS